VIVDETKGLWLHATEVATWSLPSSTPALGPIGLETGWNLTGYPSLLAQPVGDALESVADSYTLVYAYDASDQADSWKVYDPSGPPGVNDLTEMVPGRGYWIRVTQPCSWSLNNWRG